MPRDQEIVNGKNTPRLFVSFTVWSVMCCQEEMVSIKCYWIQNEIPLKLIAVFFGCTTTRPTITCMLASIIFRHLNLLTVVVKSSNSIIFLSDSKEYPDHTRSGICLLRSPAIWPFNAAKAWKRGCPTPTVSGMCVLCMSLFRSDRVEPREKKGVWMGWFGFCWKRRPACQKVWETKESRTVAILEMHTKHKKEHEWKKSLLFKMVC